MKNKQYKWLDSAIMKEDESRHTQNEKHFIMNNGTRKAVFSPTNVNYFDKSEHKWKPIDSTLKADDNGYHAQLGTYTARFSKTSSNETVRNVERLIFNLIIMTIKNVYLYD